MGLVHRKISGRLKRLGGGAFGFVGGWGNPLMFICAHLSFGPISSETSSLLPEYIHVAANLGETAEERGL